MSSFNTKQILQNDLSKNELLPKLPPSEISFGVLIIPSSQLKEQIESASIAISKVLDNEKPIDNNPFPAHISLHLGGINREFIPDMVEKLERVTIPFLGSSIKASKLYTNSRGFLAVQCNVSKDHSMLIKLVLEVCEEIQVRNPNSRPHILEKWDQLTNKQLEKLYRFGSYKDMVEDQHLSVAHVNRYDVDEALSIAKKFISLPQDFTIKSIVFAEIGHRNEKWNVLAEWS